MDRFAEQPFADPNPPVPGCSPESAEQVPIVPGSGSGTPPATKTFDEKPLVGESSRQHQSEPAIRNAKIFKGKQLAGEVAELSGLPQQFVSQVGVIPFRHVYEQPEFCLVSGRKSKRWLFPKGHLSPGLGAEESALAEALEEAGVRGRLLETALTPVIFEKSGKWIHLTMWLLEVESLQMHWKESPERIRIWASGPRSLELLDYPYLRELFCEAWQRMGVSNLPELEGCLPRQAKVKRKR